jgi:hypothetical protein
MNLRYDRYLVITTFRIKSERLISASSIRSEAGMEWTQDELARIAAADDLHVAPLREDGTTLGTPTWIWSVAVEGGLYVRAYNGVNSRWFQAAMRQKAGRIFAAGMSADVVFAPVAGAVNDRIDDAYRIKYKSSAYLAPMIGARARAATMRISPADAAQPEGN